MLLVQSLAAGSALVFITAMPLVGCNGGFYQGPDRPDDQGVEGPPPPADFHCERGERHREASDGGKSNRIVHVLGNGAVLCSTEDRNGDGTIDTWNLHENGRIVRTVTTAQTPASTSRDAGAGG